jgi:hypothetical protein
MAAWSPWLDTQSQLTHVGPHDFEGDASVRFR